MSNLWAAMSQPVSWWSMGWTWLMLAVQIAMLGFTFRRGRQTIKEWRKLGTAWKDLSQHGDKLIEEWAKVMAWRAVMEQMGTHIEGPEVDLSNVTRH